MSTPESFFQIRIADAHDEGGCFDPTNQIPFVELLGNSSVGGNTTEQVGSFLNNIVHRYLRFPPPPTATRATRYPMLSALHGSGKQHLSVVASLICFSSQLNKTVILYTNQQRRLVKNE
ncbi:unnamed protein product [Musa acuminata subsp. burmannicoides]